MFETIFTSFEESAVVSHENVLTPQQRQLISRVSKIDPREANRLRQELEQKTTEVSVESAIEASVFKTIGVLGELFKWMKNQCILSAQLPIRMQKKIKEGCVGHDRNNQ